MSDQEVIKHTEKVIHIVGDKQTTFWHKLKEFVLEICIIVFAVTISIWLHNWSEHRNEQKVTRTFLSGLKGDIREDITETKEILGDYNTFTWVYSYLSRLDASKAPDKDSLKLALSYLTTNAYLRPHKSRFNGFVSAGKIMTIENDSLTQEILSYYEEVLPALSGSEHGWIDVNDQLNSYLANNVKDFSDEMSQFQVLATPKGRHLTKMLIPWPQILERYQAVIMVGDTIIATISKMYPDRK